MIELNNITKTYELSKDNKIKALDNITLKIKKGEFVSIVGKSGSGKTTLLNIISCLDKPDSGTYYLNDINVSIKTDKELSSIRNKKIGFIFQNFNLLSKLNSYENIEIPLIYKRLSKAKRKELILNSAKQLEIEERLNHKPNELSGGQQQRVAIARALVTDPDIIIADEPTGALDESTGKQIIDILKNLNKKGKTVIIVTHDLEIANVAKRKILIKDGKIESDTGLEVTKK